jgi:hypothetical protein
LGDIWRPLPVERHVKIVKNQIDVSSHSALIAQWKIQGLSNDSNSIENTTITNISQRWPLLNDPQFQ